MRATPQRQTALVWLDVLLILAIVLLAAVWLFTRVSLHLGDFVLTLTWSIPLAVGLPLLLALRLAIAGFSPKGGLWQTQGYWKTFMAVCTPVVLLVGAEQTLELIDYDPPFTPIVFQKGDTLVAQDDRILPDPTELLWKLKPDSTYQGKPINSLGVLDRPIPPKAPNERRVFCFGDSVTAQGQPPYTVTLQSLLAPHSTAAQDWQVYNFGVPGYSSRQGLAFFRRVARDLAPDVITIWYGWNDHWLFSKTDIQRMAVPMGPLQGRLHGLLLQKRLGKLLLSLSRSSLRIRAQDSALTFRVPPDEYRDVLTEFIRDAQRIGALPVLISSPRRRIHDRIVKTGHAQSPDAAAEAHDRFNTVMREVAARENVPLLDMERILAAPEFDRFFEADGIHFDQYFLEEKNPGSIADQPGLEFVAKTLAEFLVTLDDRTNPAAPRP